MEIRIDLMELAEIISKLPTDSFEDPSTTVLSNSTVIAKEALIWKLLDYRDEHDKAKTIKESGRYADAFVMKCGE